MALSNIAVNNLTCEYLKNPLGMDLKHPRLSWILESTCQNEVQTAYQILVSSTVEELASDKGDLWDTGKVASDQSIHLAYGGEELTMGKQCHWKVRVWDKDGQPSPWSETAFWTVGPMRPADWQAKWIAMDRALPEADMAEVDETATGEKPIPPFRQDPSPILRKEFDVARPITRAYAHICGLGYHELHLNGHKVGDATLEPGFTCYHKRALYVTHDVTSMLKNGANAIGVMLGNGWFNSASRDAWNFDHTPWRNTPRLLFQMTIEYADGSTETIMSDDSWKISTGPIIFDGIRNGETYDARLEKPGWDTAGYCDADWAQALEVDGPTTNLQAQKTLPNKVIDVITPVGVTEPKPGVFVFDVGQNLSGRVKLTVSGPAGTVVTIKYDERLTEAGVLDTSNAMFVNSGPFQTDTYILKGEGVEVWEASFTYHGFQYAQIEGFPGKPSLENVKANVVHTAFESMGKFECSNDTINHTQRNALWAYVSNFTTGYPTDCPHREKNGWTGDAHIAAEMGLYNFNPQSNYTNWMYDFDDVQMDNGNLPGIIPTGDWGYDIGPAWDTAYLMIPWYMYLYSGDQRILAEHYEGFRKLIGYQTSRAEDHIVSYGLGDWCPPVGGPENSKSPAELTSTACYYYDVFLMSRIAGILGKDDDEAGYAALAEKIKHAFNKKFYDAKRGVYSGDCQTSQAAALYHGLVPDCETDKVVAFLIAEIERAGGHLDCGILGTKYVPHVLTDSGHADIAYNIATKRTFPSWGYWLEQGATTLWERWTGEGSMNHIMFGDISAWYYEALAGINPAAPGFKRIMIRPQPSGDLKWARAEHKSMYGPIRSSWSLNDGKFTLDIAIPANTTASVHVPASAQDAVTAPDVANIVGMQSGFAVYEVGSGEYRFTAVC